VNAVIDGQDIVYREYVDISVAVATPSGLMVPVIRDCQSKGFATLEKVEIDLLLDSDRLGEQREVGQNHSGGHDGGYFHHFERRSLRQHDGNPDSQSPPVCHFRNAQHR
jgi:hypothetical protein